MNNRANTISEILLETLGVVDKTQPDYSSTVKFLFPTRHALTFSSQTIIIHGYTKVKTNKTVEFTSYYSPTNRDQVQRALLLELAKTDILLAYNDLPVCKFSVKEDLEGKSINTILIKVKTRVSANKMQVQAHYTL